MQSGISNSVHDPKVFLLRATGAISAFADEGDARRASGEGDLLFRNPDELKQGTAEWPSARLIAVWNGIPGVVPVKKFTDRATAVKRIWNAIQGLEPARPDEPEQSRQASNGPKPRSGTKKATVLAMLNRAEGASVREIMTALDWQSHSVRGLLSSLSRRRRGIHSSRRADGERAYSTARLADSDAEAAQ